MPFIVNHLKLVLGSLLIALLTKFTLSAQSVNASPDTLVYRQIGQQSLKAYVFRPATKAKRHPAILLFHGGAWRLGEASWLFQRAKEFAQKGLVAISIDYRLANDGLSPIEGVEDACTAFAWARQHAHELGIDTKRVAGYGVSAGGHLIACAASLPMVKDHKITASSRPTALVLFSPALNVAQDPYFMGLMKQKGDPALYSPLQYVTSKLPPSLIIQGEKDNIVFTADAYLFRAAALKAKVRCDLVVYPGVGHLLTRNLAIQYKDFDGDPGMEAEARQKEDAFLDSLGYYAK